ncbi:Trx3p NDAI_0I00190 [Naumovozyma dairenensis CBS 421]|uniref:Thioredoxin domain-containing protein n=1 Tax=Naumovozyma dairenensis (strain ATCC 10597 / BCRC 20456 / CBS 421 / NBRC 0211 / NRRL Y-12639) TaxID=1071378 RepID=G0WFM7_NAUDC|nr:hypothetical protein NDAI_0I00190 [Naumovozyma dairenensis CBS 421]CCD26588.1 hypothetical protein NDAI_0I00190 [Naumovozyma dairenensis CBS 421]
MLPLFRSAILSQSRAVVSKRVLVMPILRYNSTSSSYETVKKLNELTELTKIIDEKSSNRKLSVIDFYATWCQPCKAMSPIITKLMNEHPDVNFYKVDVDESPSLAQHCNVSAMPTFVLTKDGAIADTIVGANPSALKKSITDLK